MRVPGSNLLRQAQRMLHFQHVEWYRAAGRTINSVGQNVTSYLNPQRLKGSWQAVPRSLYLTYGLDLQKEYYTFYASANILDVARDISADQLIFNGNTYQVESANDWFAMDGWVGVLVVLTNLPIPVNSGPIFSFDQAYNFDNAPFADGFLG